MCNATQTELPKIAAIHRRAFPNSLATAMGQTYVEKMLEWFLSTNKTYLYYTRNEDGEIVGYTGAMLKDGVLPTGSASGMLQYSFNNAIIAFIKRPWLVFHKEMKNKYKLMISNILRKFFKIGNVITPESFKSSNENIPVLALVVMGTNPELFSKGVGSAMLQESDKLAKRLNVNKLELTVLIDNERAIKADERNGWKRGAIHGKGMTMYKYV